ncbi:hypothetical protein C9374_014453 [Naegleria lovaniensis]|uniref:Uncharacterized protein n=1 Tax=Naegleria lovaniensis TaxID=51637 RepID=A0AA88H0X2_NAELO|nr:uncharacterized protein C9374_014453 [Naegleria lovaniensis]KAG2389053.1 hypothetical protein C9374_014453 [Naegleria lovaniensis]
MKRKHFESFSHAKNPSSTTNVLEHSKTIKTKQQQLTNRIQLPFQIFDIDEIVAWILQFMTTTDYFVYLRFVNRCFHRLIEEGILSGLIFKNITLDNSSFLTHHVHSEHNDQVSLESVTIQHILQEYSQKKSKRISKNSKQSLTSLTSKRLLHIISNHSFAIQSWKCAYGVREMTLQVFENLIEKCHNLQEIFIESSQLESIKMDPKSLPQLQSFTLVMRSFSFRELIFGEENSKANDDDMNCFEHLQTLSITIHRSDDSFKTLFTHAKLFPNLVHFTFHTAANSSLSSHQIITISRSMIHLCTPNLETVSIRSYSKRFMLNGQFDHLRSQKYDGMMQHVKLLNLEHLKSLTVLVVSCTHAIIPSLFIYNCPDLIHVNLPMGANALCPITKFMLSHLKELELDVAEMIHDTHVENNDNRSITTLPLTWMSILRDQSNLPSLQHLHLYSSSDETIQSLELKGFKRLKSLSIELENLDLTLKNMKKLREFNISCKNLKLHLYKCRMMTEKELDHILDTSRFISSLTVSKCSELRRLDLSKNSSGRYLKHFKINKCQNLEWLCCDSSRTTSGEVKNCTNLKFIKAKQFSINTSQHPTRSINKMLLVTNLHPKLEIMNQ